MWLQVLDRNALLNSLYAAITIIVLTLTGIFGSFARRFVLEDQLSLSSALLVGTLIGTGFLAANTVRKKYLDPITGEGNLDRRAASAVIANGMAGGLLVAALLAVVIAFTTAVNVRFVFQNIGALLGGPLVFGQTELFPGILTLLIAGILGGAVGGLLVFLPQRARDVLVVSVLLTTVLGILQGQINNIITLPDVLLITVVFAVASIAVRMVRMLRPSSTLNRVLLGAGIGIALGMVFALLAQTGLAADGWMRLGGRVPQILGLTVNGNAVFFIIVCAAVGILGAVVTWASSIGFRGAWWIIIGLFVLGVLNWQGEMTTLAAVLTFALVAIGRILLPPVGRQAEARFHLLPVAEQRRTTSVMLLGLLALLIVVPLFAGLSITNTINLTALYVTMGIGLSVMIGYAGLLDLGYVASYAIGAYTIGLLTTPSLLTCGGLTADQLLAQGYRLAELPTVCTGVMSFWTALPVAVLVSALSGMLLGVPVLRLRGDYLAIVTLGFGEIVQVLIRSTALKPLLGGAQGIIQIPTPRVNFSAVNPTWDVTLTRSTDLYYLYIFCVIVAAFVVLRLVNTRLGRAWRAMREDEDVAEAMGIRLVGTKLLAFGISSSFAGLGGAVFGASYQSIFPNSFTLLVSINVLSLIIIGGMGSIPGVILGSFILIGLPELMRELQDYRLLAFGALLVAVMILRPEGLLPPKPPRLSEFASGGDPERQVPDHLPAQPQGAD
jgi:ABC-type branched-subunit amino acid transport system permease subunit